MPRHPQITIRHKKQIEDRLQRGESLRSIAKSFKVTYQTLQYHRRGWGGLLLRKAYTKGDNHASWKGGFFIDRWGYKMVLAPYRGNKNPYSPEHIIVAEQKLGRRLIKTIEVVHHIDGDKRNNGSDNLIVVTKSQHRLFHRQLESIGFELVQKGFIIFDGKQYILK